MWPMVFYFRTNKPLIYSRNVDLMQKIYVSMLFLLSLNCTDFVLLLLNAAKATATMATVADTPAMMLATTFEEASWGSWIMCNSLLLLVTNIRGPIESRCEVSGLTSRSVRLLDEQSVEHCGELAKQTTAWQWMYTTLDWLDVNWKVFKLNRASLAGDGRKCIKLTLEHPFSMSVINTLSYGVDVFVAMHVSRCIPNPDVSLFGRPTLMKISELSSISLGVLRSLSACLNWFVSYCRISIFKCPNRFSYTLTCCLTGWYEDMVISVLG